jgi:hypothetical protein
MSREGVPLLVIQRQARALGSRDHIDYLRGIDNTEIITTVHERPADPGHQRAHDHALIAKNHEPDERGALPRAHRRNEALANRRAARHPSHITAKRRNGDEMTTTATSPLHSSGPVGGGRLRSWLCDSAIRPAAGAKAVVPSSGRARVDPCEKQWRRGLLAGDGRQPPFVRNNKLEPTLAGGDVEAARTSQARQRPASGRRPLPLSRFPQLMARSVPSRPIKERGGRRRRWLLPHVSESQARLQVSADRSVSKHLGDSRNRRTGGLAPCRSRHRDRRRTGDAHLWRGAGPAKLGDSDLLWPRDTHVGTRAEG